MTCEWCNGPIAAGSRSRWCSATCRVSTAKERKRLAAGGPPRAPGGGFELKCVSCGSMFVAKYATAMTCSNVCNVKRWRRENPEKAKAAQNERHRRRYREDPAYAQRFRDANAAWKIANRARASELQRLRQAGIRPGGDRYIERVDPDVLWEAHGGFCGICHEFVPRAEMVVDHVMPLSKGGMHGYVNTQPAHALCNGRKYNKIPTALAV